jgi:hypothetical protein
MVVSLNETVGTGLTEIVNKAVVAHIPDVGVKVYNVVAVLLIAGDHVPVILLLEIKGNDNPIIPLQ